MGLATLPSDCPAISPQLVDGRPIAGGMSLSELGLVLSAAMMVWSLFVSGTHLVLHAMHFSNRQEQVRLMRVILTVPVFAVSAFVAILLRINGLYIIPWLDVWASIALTSYFLLLCAYIAPDEQGQVAYFTSGRKNYRRFRWTWILVFQSVPVSFAIAVVQDTTIAVGKYCIATLESNSAKPYLVCARLTSILVAVAALLRLADHLRPSLNNQHLRRQLWTFKSLIVLNTILQFTFAILSYFLQPTETLSLVSISITLPMLILSIFTVFYALAFLYAFSWRPYSLEGYVQIGRDGQPLRYVGGPYGLIAIGHALNPVDMVQSLYRTTQLLFYRRMPEVMTPKYMSISGTSSPLRTPRSQAWQASATVSLSPSPRSHSPYTISRPAVPPHTGYTSPTHTIPSSPYGSTRSLHPPPLLVSPRQIPKGRPNLDKSLPLPPPSTSPEPATPFETLHSINQRSTSQRSAYVPVQLAATPSPLSATIPTPTWSPLARGAHQYQYQNQNQYQPLESLAELPPKSPLPILELEVPMPVRITEDGAQTYGFSPLGDQVHDFIDEYRMTIYQQQHRF